jgi:hypothetical protein
MTFKYGNKEYTLKYGVRALIKLEEYFNVPISKIADKFMDSKNLSIRDLYELFKAGLAKNKPPLTDEDIEEIIDSMGFNKIAELVGKAFQESFEPAKEVKEEMQNF